MDRLRSALIPCVLVAIALAPADGNAQIYSSVGAGVAVPTGDFGDNFDTGWTVRGQLGLSFVLVDGHVQAGWSRFPGKDSVEDADIYHAGVGARVGLGLVFVGANAAYFFGDGEDGVGFFPEIGAHIGPIEAVADYRIDGDNKWLGARVGLRF
ncbi:MAG: hypothetical protein P8177_12170 [Gemmatimonadota bacterium]|jgi:hypothetical protein